MIAHKPKGAEWVVERNNYARSFYGAADAFAREVEDIYTGEFAVPQYREDTDIQIVNPSKGRVLVQKEMSLLAIRSQKIIRIPPRDGSKQERARADRLERWLDAFLEEHAYQTQRDVFYDGAFFTLLRGRGVWEVGYDPLKEGMKVRMRAHDPLTTFPVWSDDGIDWYTREYLRPRQELADFFDRFDTDDRALKFPVPELNQGEMSSSPDWVRVIEYCDSEWRALVVDGKLVGPMEHGYGFVPLVASHLNSTPLSDRKWASMSLLGMVAEELKLHASTMSMIATAQDQFFFPRMYFRTTDGRLVMIDAHAAPGDFTLVDQDADPIILNPATNQALVQSWLSQLEQAIGHGTVNPIVFTTDLPNASGFMVSQFLSQIRDQIAGVQDELERGFGRGLGYVLQLLEKFAPLQDDRCWYLPVAGDNRKPTFDRLTAGDIDGLHRVRISIKVALPQDRLQMVAMLGQLRSPGPDGLPMLDRQSAFVFSGMDEVIPDYSDSKRRLDWEYLINADPTTKQLYTEAIRADYQDEIREMTKQVARSQKREQAFQQRQAEREAEKMGEEPLVIPPDKWQDAALMHQIATLIEQGHDPRPAIDGSLPFGVPGESPVGGPTGPQADPAMVQQLMASMQGPGGAPQQPVGETPDGLTGYGGINPAQLPPAMQGAQPRQVVDRPNVDVQQMQQLFRRGALPPPK